MSPSTAAPFGFPSTVTTIISIELLERYAFYAFRSILTPYFITLGFTESTSISLYMYTSGLIYFTPIIGGFVSDTYLGKYCTILVFCIVYIGGLGLLSLAAGFENSGLTFLAIFLIGLGSGGVKPCVSAFGADQVRSMENDNNNMQRYFSYFYFSINLGALISYITSPIISHNFGYAYAFAVPGLFMIIAVAIFVSMRKKFFIMVPKEGEEVGPILILFVIVWRASLEKVLSLFANVSVSVSGSEEEEYRAIEKKPFSSSSSMSFLSRAVSNTNGTDEDDEDDGDGDEGMINKEKGITITITSKNIAEAEDFFRTLKFFCLLPVFWMLYDQQGSSWLLQSTRMKLPSYIQPSQLGVINTILVLLLLPFSTIYFYPYLKSKGISVTPLKRMTVGMFAASLSFVLMGLLEVHISQNPPNSVTVLYQLPCYVLMTIGEIGVSTTGLEFFYNEAPVTLKTAASALFLLTTSIGDVMGGVLFKVKDWGGWSDVFVFGFCGGFMGVVAVVFGWFCRGYEYRDEGGGVGGEVNDDGDDNDNDNDHGDGDSDGDGDGGDGDGDESMETRLVRGETEIVSRKLSL